MSLTKFGAVSLSDELRSRATLLAVGRPATNTAGAMRDAAARIEELEAEVERMQRFIANEVVRLDRALDAMNDAVLLTFRSGSSAPGMEFIADWLSNRDACSEAVIAELGDTPFPPDPERQVEA